MAGMENGRSRSEWTVEVVGNEGPLAMQWRSRCGRRVASLSVDPRGIVLRHQDRHPHGKVAESVVDPRAVEGLVRAWYGRHGRKAS